MVSPMLLCLACNILQCIAPFLRVAIGFALVRLPTALSGSPVLPFVYSICSIMNGYSSSEIFELMAHSHTIAHYEDRIHPLCISIMAGITTDTLGSSDARSSSCGKSPLDERVMPATSEMSPNSTFCDVKPDGRSLKIVAVSNVRQCLLRGSSPW
jgi:hypothetical protein